jgi:hypothetical protein
MLQEHLPEPLFLVFGPKIAPQLRHLHFFTFGRARPVGAWLIRQHHQSLHNGAETNEYNKQLEKICKFPVRGELFNRPKADRADDHDNQNPNQK